MEFEALYRALSSRDARFDGRVFIGVVSTKVYCRPTCPVPMPRRDGVKFFATAAAAEAAGFRACRRCRPELSPDSPDWDIRADIVGRGLRLIADGVIDREGVEALAHRLAVTSRHLRRLFVQELGAGPGEIAKTRRARLAKQLLEQTDLTSIQVAFAAGFSSVRTYNETLRRVYGLSPTEIRDRRRRDDRDPGHLTLRLAYRPPLAAGPLLAFLANCAIPGIEEVDEGKFLRGVRTRNGRAVVISLRPHPAELYATLEVDGDEIAELGAVVQAARRLFDLDAEPATVDDTLAADPALRPLVRRMPGLRLPGAADGFELAVRAVLGQQVSVRRAGVLAGRVAIRYGTPLERVAGTITHLFPTAEQLAGAPLGDVGLTPSRARTIRRLAELVAAGTLNLSGSGDPAEALRTLREVPGIGPWTSAYVAMRGLRDPDAFAPTDLGVRRGCAAIGLATTPRAILARSERWRPWRAYAMMHLLRAAG